MTYRSQYDLVYSPCPECKTTLYVASQDMGKVLCISCFKWESGTLSRPKKERAKGRKYGPAAYSSRKN